MLFQQWFWYRIGSTGGESSIDTISAPNVTTFLGTRGVSLEYVGNDFTVETTYILTGGSIGVVSDLAEIISIRNTNSEGAPLDFHFFQYSDFDLCNIGGDTVNVVSGNLVRQWHNNCSLSETVVAPGASHWEAGQFAVTRNNLNNASPTTLNGVSSLAGYVTGASGRAYAVVIMVNHKSAQYGPDEAIQGAVIDWVLAQ